MSDIDFVIVSCIVNGNSDRHDTASQRLKLKLSGIQQHTMLYNGVLCETGGMVTDKNIAL